MGRKSDSDGLIILIVYTIGLIFIIIGYTIKFLENVHKYNLWKNFWITFPFLVAANYIGYTFINTNSDISISLFLISWLIFIIYWGYCFGEKVQQERKKIQSQKDEIICQIAVSTPNCPYCGFELKKMPMRKTRCPHCDNFIFVRTRPTDNKTFLVSQENIHTLESQWKNKKNVISVPVIDVTDEMNEVLKYLTANYETFCNYQQIKEIYANDRLKIMSYMWKHWNIRINDKEMYEEFSQYDKELLNEIRDIEENRRYTYFKIQEFKDRGWNKEPLIKTGWLPYEYGTAMGICTINSMINVYEWYLKKYNEEEHFPDFLEMPYDCFLEDAPSYKIYLFKDNDFQQITLKELKDFCKKNNYGYPYEE